MIRNDTSDKTNNVGYINKKKAHLFVYHIIIQCVIRSVKTFKKSVLYIDSISIDSISI